MVRNDPFVRLCEGFFNQVAGAGELFRFLVEGVDEDVGVDTVQTRAVLEFELVLVNKILHLSATDLSLASFESWYFEFWFGGTRVWMFLEIVVYCPPYQFTDWSIRLRCYFSKLGQDRLRKEYLQFLHGSMDNMDTDAGATWVVA